MRAAGNGKAKELAFGPTEVVDSSLLQPGGVLLRPPLEWPDGAAVGKVLFTRKYTG